jgi:hypothetical protein
MGGIMRSFLLSTLLAASVCIAFAQPTVDGDLGDAQYILLATKANSNSGFGSNIDVTKIYYYPDVGNSHLYLGVAGKLNTGSNDGIGVWLNVTGTGSPTGKASGQALGIQSTGGHYIGANNDGGNVNFKADFEVDYMFAFNPGGGASSVFFDAAKHVTSSVIEFQGSCNQTGTSATNSSAGGTVFGQNTITFAFNNGGGATQGLEMRIPFAQIGATSAMQIEVFAFVVSSTAFFSDVTVPGNRTGGNPGFNADFSTMSGGSYHTTSGGSLPVQLASFTSQRINATSVRLDWRTATELNNYGFFVQKRTAANGEQWDEIPGSFRPGRGTTSEPQTYSYLDNAALGHPLQYRLKQVDLDGTVHFTEPITVSSPTNVSEVAPKQFSLKQNYPNPFNPETRIEFAVEKPDHAVLEVFTALGEHVATLYNAVAEAGKYYTVRFDATNLAGGTYFYRLKSGANSAFKKLILLK